jgi:hypothetical protein
VNLFEELVHGHRLAQIADRADLLRLAARAAVGGHGGIGIEETPFNLRSASRKPHASIFGMLMSITMSSGAGGAKHAPSRRVEALTR